MVAGHSRQKECLSSCVRCSRAQTINPFILQFSAHQLPCLFATYSYHRIEITEHVERHIRTVAAAAASCSRSFKEGEVRGRDRLCMCYCFLIRRAHVQLVRVYDLCQGRCKPFMCVRNVCVCVRTRSRVHAHTRTHTHARTRDHGHASALASVCESDREARKEREMDAETTRACA